MRVPSYQIHNILRSYSREICQGKISETQKTEIADERRRQAVIDRVGADIIERITRVDSRRNGIRRRRFPQTFNRKREGEFVYHMLDGSHKKSRHIFSVKDAGVLLKEEDF